ncbi:pectinesterase inhibitor-like [Sesamum indicum]|uniref:Pectinesterase inhibitor-like n=1 Tax=Sesamum indicum TaxID=4182 RepID=A0A6I9UIK0_SESIN|nr:pectinesterase inhibitor-like [Sesamum indicum]
MDLPFAPFIIKTLLLSLLNITGFTANANYGCAATPTARQFPDICPKTKHPDVCFYFLNRDPRTCRASSLPELGLGALHVAIQTAEHRAFTYNTLAKMIGINRRLKRKYVQCRDNYTLARRLTVQAKNNVQRNEYAEARRRLEVACEVPNSCRKEVGEPAGGKEPNEISYAFFEFALVVVKELEVRKKT